MSRRTAATALFAALALAACVDRAEHVPVARVGSLSVYDAYAPASAAPDIASLYFAVVNAGTDADTLLAIRIANGRAELHDVVTEGGLTRMQHVPALAIPAGSTVRLLPGGYHVMLTGLAAPLEVGQTVAVELVFARAGTARFAAPVLTYTEVVERLERTAR